VGSTCFVPVSYVLARVSYKGFCVLTGNGLFPRISAFSDGRSYEHCLFMCPLTHQLTVNPLTRLLKTSGSGGATEVCALPACHNNKLR